MPYSYDAYTNQQQLQAQRGPDTGGDRQIGGMGLGYSGGAGGSYAYNPNWSGGQFVRENLKQDFSSPMNYISGAGSIGQTVRAFKGRSAFKKARNAEREAEELFQARKANAIARNPTDWLNTQDPTGRTSQEAARLAAQGRPMSAEELNASLRTDNQNAQREGFMRQIEDYFGSPERAGWQQSIVQNRLNQDLANAQEDYGNNLRTSVQSAAARGLRGGSVDVEGRGAVARTRDTGAIQAAQNADTAAADFRNQDLQARDQLKGLVNSGDIGEADSLRSAIEGIHSATTASGQRYAGQQQQNQINRYGQQQQSQAWGQGLSGLAAAIDRNPNRGNSLSAWYGTGTSRGGW